jgi:hypothetical protein
MPSPLEKVKQKASSVSIAQLLKQIPDIRGTDYDLEGYYADHGIPYKSLEDMALSHAITGAHYSDEYKLPWHPSFSTHSKYSDQDIEGGKWQQGGSEGSELWNFTPSAVNMEYNSPEAYKQMWLENQPKGTFITLPSGDVIEGNERNYADGGIVDKLRSANFSPNDSVIASTINHPIEGAKRAADWFRRNVNTAAGIADPYDNPNTFSGYTPEQQIEAALNLAGSFQGGAFASGAAPKSAGGTLGTFIGRNSTGWDATKAAEAEKLLNAGVDPAEIWKSHLIGRMPDKTLFSEISDKDALYHEHGKDFYDSTINKTNQLLKHGRDTARYPLNVQDMLRHPSFYENYPNLEATELRYLPDTSTAKGAFGYFADNGDPVLNIHGMLPNDEAKSTMLHELQHAIQRNEGWGQGGDLGSASSFYIENHLSPKLKALNTSLIENGKLRDTITNEDEYAANVLRHKQIVAERDKLDDEISNIENNQAPKLRLYKRLTGEAQARATQDRLDMDMAQRRENYPLAGGKLSDIPLEELIYKYEGNGPSLSMDPRWDSRYAEGGAVQYDPARIDAIIAAVPKFSDDEIKTIMQSS